MLIINGRVVTFGETNEIVEDGRVPNRIDYHHEDGTPNAYIVSLRLQSLDQKRLDYPF